MLSRVAESFYWLQRYRERAENTARLLAVNVHLMADAPFEIGNQWKSMLSTTSSEEEFARQYEVVNQSNVIEFLVFNEKNPNSIISCLYQARENARTIRETITTEMWQEMNTLYLFVQQAKRDSKKIEAFDSFFKKIKTQCQLFTGITDTCMSHNEAWYFGRVGNLIERADMTTRILDAKYYKVLPSNDYLGSAYDNVQWLALLKSIDALQMYRRQWHQVTPERVVHFLLLDKNFPRAVLSCLLRLRASILFNDKNADVEKAKVKPIELIDALNHKLEGLTGAKIIALGLHEFLDMIQSQLIEIHLAIYNRFFAVKPIN